MEERKKRITVSELKEQFEKLEIKINQKIIDLEEQNKNLKTKIESNEKF